jgi:4-nitrophenyl phosphatase
MDYAGAILDVDGTLVRGTKPISGVERGLGALAAHDVDHCYVSNNPTKTPAAYAEKLRAAGIEAIGPDVVTSGSTTVEYLRRHHEGETVYLVGEDGLHAQLEGADFPVVVAGDWTGQAVDVAVVSIDREFTYDTLTESLAVLHDGTVPIVGTDPDLVIPAPDGDVPGSGAIVNAVANVAERDPDAVLGKPHDIARELALDRLGCDAADCLVVGDRLDTDIELGARSGMTTVLVRTGVTDERRLARASVTPDYVLDEFGDVGKVLDGSAERFGG